MGDEPRILNDVCSAFILGLHDSTLVTQLSSYTSITPILDPSLPFLQRTLHGVWTQIDGERLALRWEHRSLPEINDKLEADGADAIYGWRALQDRQDSVAEPLIYNRQLTAAAERLKRFDSLRLMCLEQIQYEEPVYYFGRAQKILENFKNHSKISSDQIMRIAIERYAQGIFNPEIRQALCDRVQHLNDSTATLSRVALHHRILQLAADYEHALKLRLYDDCKKEDKNNIEKYIKHLRGLEIEDIHKPADVEISQLISKMKSLPDPTKLSTSKPRDRYQDHLEFPKAGVGIQCDINFSAQLALHNTQLLRCYSYCDPRVRPMILFIKHWAKVRGINSPYRGTLSSYGYVLMVLHFLVNVAMPFVLPNLQEVKRDPPPYLSPADIEARTVCNGRDVRFWRNEMEIQDLAQRNMLNHNRESIGLLLRGFFEYYAQGGPMSTVQNRGFDWGREVLSIRTHGGILTKQEKGWVGAKTIVETTTIAAPPTPSMAKHTEHANNGEESPTSENEVHTPRLPVKTVEETKEVRHRYLFAIEDPFELDHNVARTVTHNGIVSIRDEFRRAWRFIRDAKTTTDGVNFLDPVEKNETKSEFLVLLDLIHGGEGELNLRA
jgi:DNA polymerase sigma